MHETLESVQLKSKKVIDGAIKVYLIFLSLPLILIDREAQILSLLMFTSLSVHAAGKHYFRLIKIPIFFLAASTVVILLITDGKEILSLGLLRVTDKSVEVALTTLIRSFATLSALIYLVLTTTVPEIVSAFRFLPFFIRELLLMTYRVIQHLIDDAFRLHMAAEARSGYFGFKRWINTTALLAYSLFLKSLRRAEMFDMAMESRCYSGIYPVQNVKNKGMFVVAVIVTLLVAGYLL